jgi:transcriptional regulator with XRE-family HTH domain
MSPRMRDNALMGSSPESVLAVVDLIDFGRRLRATRRDRGMTQEAVAGQEISAAYISRIEAGQRRPELAVARLIADRLGTSLEYLVTGLEPRQAAETRLVLRYAELALKSGEATEAERQLRQLLASADQLGSLEREVRWFHALSLEALGRLDEAVALLESLTSHADGTPDLQASIALSRCYREAGDLGHAIDVAERAGRHAADAGLRGTDDDIRLTVTLVAAFLERGDLAHASHLCREAMSRAEQNASAPARAAAYWNASILASKRARHAEALSLAERALALLAEGEDDRNLARLRTLLGLLSMRQDEPDIEAAERHLDRALIELRDRDGSQVDIARCQLGLAQAVLLSGDHHGAIERASAALETVASVAPFVSANAEVLIGRARFALADPAGARQHFANAVGLLTAAQSDRDAGQLWYELGELFEAAGDDTSARDAYRSAAAAAGLRSAARITAPV